MPHHTASAPALAGTEAVSRLLCAATGACPRATVLSIAAVGAIDLFYAEFINLCRAIPRIRALVTTCPPSCARHPPGSLCGLFGLVLGALIGHDLVWVLRCGRRTRPHRLGTPPRVYNAPSQSGEITMPYDAQPLGSLSQQFGVSSANAGCTWTSAKHDVVAQCITAKSNASTWPL